MGRRVVLGNMAALALAWVIFLVGTPRISATDFIATGVFAIAAALTIVAVPAVVRRGVRPLPAGLSEDDARRQALDQFGDATAFATAVALVVPYLALFVAMMTKNPWTYAVPFVVAEVMLYVHALPAPQP